MTSLLKVKKFAITFPKGNPKGSFYADQPIQGAVEVWARTALKIKELRLALIGYSLTQWAEWGSKKKKKDAVRYYDHGAYGSQKVTRGVNTATNYGGETYIDEEKILWGAHGFEGTLPPGSHKFPFTFDLPPDAPSSFQGKYGCVRFGGKKIRRVLSILGKEDISQFPILRNPALMTITQPLLCLCRKVGTLSCEIRLPRVGYAGGEDIPITLKIENESHYHLKSVTGQLVQKVTFMAFGDLPVYRKYQTNTLKTEKWAIPKTQKKHVAMSGLKLRIPMVPGSLLGCRYIEIGYELHLLVKTKSLCPSSVTFVAPFIMGTVPLSDAILDCTQMGRKKKVPFISSSYLQDLVNKRTSLSTMSTEDLSSMREENNEETTPIKSLY